MRTINYEHMQVDNREHKAIEILKRSDVPIVISPLPVADFIINGEPSVYVERKTWADLSASMKDSRLDDQLSRLKATGARVLYIIEGSPDDLNGRGVPLKAMRGMLLRMTLSSGVGLIYTKSTEETCDILVQMYQGLQKNSGKYAPKDTTTSGVADHLCKGMKRGDQIDEKTCFMMMLTQIPGIGAKYAKTLAEKYTNIAELCRESSEKVNVDILEIPGWGKTRLNALKKYVGL